MTVAMFRSSILFCVLVVACTCPNKIKDTWEEFGEMMCNTREYIQIDCPERAEQRRKDKAIFCRPLTLHQRRLYDCDKKKKKIGP